MVQWVKNPPCNAADMGPGNQDPTRLGETKPVCSNYWALEPQLRESVHHKEKTPHATTKTWGSQIKKKKNSNILVWGTQQLFVER